MRATTCIALQILCTFLWTTKTFAQTTSCNTYGNRVVCNTYYQNGTMDQTTVTNYGNTSTVNRSSSPYETYQPYEAR